MTDRELLEKAAKAAGYSFLTDGESKDAYIAWNGREPTSWNPLTDDGDALRLAVKLKMDVQANEASASVQTWQSDIGETKEVIEYFDYPEDAYAATRRAIVRAAAAIGEQQ